MRRPSPAHYKFCAWGEAVFSFLQLPQAALGEGEGNSWPVPCPCLWHKPWWQPTQGWGGSRTWMWRCSSSLPAHGTPAACSWRSPIVATAQSCWHGQAVGVTAILIAWSWTPAWIVSGNEFYASLASPWISSTLQLALCRADLLQFYQHTDLEEETIELISQLKFSQRSTQLKSLNQHNRSWNQIMRY